MSRTLPLLVAALTLLALAGCDTFENRTRQKAAVFAALDPQTRAKLQGGVIELGQTPDMVYIALGAPDDEYENASAHGTEKTWIYNSYHQEFAGNQQTGYRRVLVYNPDTRRYTSCFEPVCTNIFVEHTEERIRITFRDGKVTVIEQPKLP
jgi:hypothetical protein